MDGVGPRILHLIPADGIGGVEVAARSMAARHDLPCRFLLQFIEPAPPAGRTLASAVGVMRANVRAFRRARAFHPDVIVCSLWRSVPLALALRMADRRARLVYFLHSNVTVHRLDTLLSKLAMHVSDQIWGDSVAALRSRHAPPEHSRVISFVTDHVAPVASPVPQARFVSWGRLHHLKGYDRAIRLVSRLVERGRDVRYDLYGPDDGEGEALLELVRASGLEGRVFLRGPVARETLADIARDHTFFLQPSRVEGMCMAAVEAMQFGLVPVTTAVGEMAHYVVPGRTGIIVTPDAMGEALDAIETLIDDPAAWRRRSDAASRHWRDMPLYADGVCAAATDLVMNDA